MTCLSSQRFVPIFLICAAATLVACRVEELVPISDLSARPTRTQSLTPESLETPAPRDTPRSNSTSSTLEFAGKDPLIPVLGPYPPVPIPQRAANINPLTGLSTDPAMLQRRPVLIRIGNDERVRSNFWQAGTSSADIVFEELIDQIGAQYTNTRLTAVFLANDAPLVGPVRSGRLINLQLVPMLDGALANAGASDGVRWIFSQTPMINLDEHFNMPAYCYNNPHGYVGRLYTTIPRLRQWTAQKGLEKPVPLFGFVFSDALPKGQRVDSISINEAPWPKWAAVEWRYDPNNQKYLRWVAGSPLIDTSYGVTARWGNGADCVMTGGETRTQVAASNVVVLYAKHEPTTIVEDSNKALSVYISLFGQGDVDIFRDGVQIRGRWQRSSVQEFFEFVDGAGNTIPLKPGNTWFEIVPLGYSLDL